MSDPPAGLVDSLVDRYALERELGRGGMATVYLAQDLKHDRQVAIKVLHPELAVTLGAERFLREIQIEARLNHPHILPLHDSGQANGFLFYVMPYVEGESLRDRMKGEGPLPVEDAIQISREVASALTYAHEHGILHRDIKPENILLSAGEAVVADFGIARAVGVAGGEQLTATGMSLGTPAYMSPEQAAGEETLDGRSDIYSLGCVLYEMLAGEPPYTGPTAQAVIAKRLSEPIPHVSTLRATVPGGVEQALEKALARAPVDRFPTAAAFAEALTPDSLAETWAAATSRVPRAQRVLVGLVALIVIVLGGQSVLRWLDGGSAASANPLNVMAVLPLAVAEDGNPEVDFAIRLIQAVGEELGKVGALTVKSPLAIEDCLRAGMTLREMAEELGVGTVLDLRVHPSEGALSVDVELMDANTLDRIWTESFEDIREDAFEVRNLIAQRVIRELGATITAAETSVMEVRPTEDDQAYNLYLAGEEYRRRPLTLEQDLLSAQNAYERALELDPDFALAHARIAEVLRFRYVFHDLGEETKGQIRHHAEEALRLAPDLPEAHVAMAIAHYVETDYVKALEEFEIALQGLPSEQRIWEEIGYAYRRKGDYDQALNAFQHVAELNPRDAPNFHDLGGSTYWLLNRYADAVREFNRALQLAPDYDVAAVDKGWLYLLWCGQPDTLRAALDLIPPDKDLGHHLGPVGLERARLLLWEQKGDSLLNLMASVRDPVLASQMELLPASLFSAWAHRLLQDSASARGAFEASLVLLDSMLVQDPVDWRLHAARGLTVAGLGRTQDALEEAHWLEESDIYQRDRFNGFSLREYRARILAQAGEAEAALDELEELVPGPSFYVSAWSVRLSPLFDPIRDHPRFRALLEQYAGDVSH